ncbi:bromodomain adjacent to zinc finger domain protein 2B-like isoform X4 [Amblyomma americanum]
MDNSSRNAASSPARNHFDTAALLAMSPPSFPPSTSLGVSPFPPFSPLLARGTAFQSPPPSSSPNHLLEGVAASSACSSRATQPPPASSSPSLPSGAWWSSADQGGMTLASLLRQGTTPGLASGSKLDHALRQQPSPSPSQSRRRMNGSQALGKMLPPSAHSRSSKHLDLLQDSIILNSVKEKLLLGSAKGPPGLSPPFLGPSGADLLAASGKAGGGAESSRPGITLPLGSLVRERSGQQGRRSRRGRRESGLTSAAAAKLADCLMLQQPSSSPSRPPSGGGSAHLAPPSLFPSPAHSSQIGASSSGTSTARHSPAPPAHLGAAGEQSSSQDGGAGGGAMPLDLCVKRSPIATAFLSPEVTLTPVGPPAVPGPPPPPAAHQRHILETLPASLSGGKGGPPLGAPLGPSSSSSRRRGRRPRSSPLLSEPLGPPRDCSPMGLLLGALAAQNAKLSPRQQESLQRFQLLASQGYKSRNNTLPRSGPEVPGRESSPSASSGGSRPGSSLSVPLPPLGAPSPMARPPSREAPPRQGTKRSSPEGEASREQHRPRSKRQEVEHNASVSADSSSDSESAVGDSRSMSGTSDTEDTEKSAAASTSSSIPTSLSERVSKRHTDEHEGSPKRRRCYVTDEREVRIPLERGWQRQTRVRCFSKSGVKGEVVYIAPCGKKLKNYPEVLRYLQKNNITDIGRENFSFSSRIIVGTFIESMNGGEGTDDCRVLSEEEMALRLRLLCGVPAVPSLMPLPPSSAAAAAAAATSGASPLLGLPGLAGAHPLSTLAGATSAGGSRRGRPRSRPSPDPQERALQEAAALLHHRHFEQQHVEEARRQQEHEKLLKQQERLERLEQQRIEKELRTQQMIEEMQKRREMLLMVDLERERRRQHMLLVRALENRKKMEDQKKVELQILKEVRRPVEDMILKDALPLPTLNRIPGLKVPGTAFANLLMVREFLHNFGETLHFDVDKIPSLNSLQLGLINHDSKSEQQLLTVVQHLLTCAIHDPGTPSCKEAVTVLGQHVKDASITNDSVTEALHLYFMALDKECAMYQWVTEKPFLALNPTQKSEIMAFLCNELLCSRIVVRQVDSSIETVNTLRKDKWLAEGELRKLRSTQQSRQRKAILKQELENNAAAANTAQSSSSSSNNNNNNSNNNNNGSSSNNTNGTTAGELCPNHAAANGSSTPTTNKDSEESSAKGETASEAGDKASKSGRDDEEDNEDAANDSGNESDDPQEADNAEEEEDSELSLTNEELEKRIEKLSKQQAQFQSKVAKASSSIRAVMLGQDRFRRRYWLLPVAGGVFVEAMESCEQDGMGDFVATDYMADEDDSSSEDSSSVAKEAASAKGNATVKEEGKQQEGEENAEDIKTPLATVKQEPEAEKQPEDDVSKAAASTTSEVKKECDGEAEKPGPAEGNKDQKEKEKKAEGGTPASDEKGSSSTKEAPVAAVPTSAANLSAVTMSTSSAPATPVSNAKSPAPEPTLEQSWMIHSPFFASIIAGNMLFNSGTFSAPASSASSPSPSPQMATPGVVVNMGKDGASSLLGGFTAPLSADQSHKNVAQKKSKPWFSLLPRVPCDDESLARLPGSKDVDDDDMEEEVSSTVGSTVGTRIVSVIETEDTTNQYDKPQPVPPEYLRGWWRITDSAQLRTLMGALHSNGIREKALLKQLEKNFNYGTVACIPNSQQDVGLEITDLDREVSEKHGGAPPPDYEDQWSPEVALRVDMAILAQVEALEDRLFEAFLEVKTWRPPPKASDDSSVEYRPSCVFLNKKLLASSDDDDEEDSSASQASGVPSPCEVKNKTCEKANADNAEKENQDQVDVDITADETQGMSSSPAQKDGAVEDDDVVKSGAEENAKQGSPALEENYVNPIEVAKERLLGLEAGIERRYLRPPLGTSGRSLPQTSSGSGSGNGNGSSKAEDDSSGKGATAGPGEEEEEEPVLPPALVRWREAVAACQTASQLAMCLAHLEACIAWDRSVMKASCQFCHSGDNEGMLLLCDGCDKGYHTYCFKPKMDRIPAGDWYCYECLNKTQDEKVCILCGKKGKLVRCDACPKVFHLTCLDPPLSKPPKGKWCCSGCAKGRKKGRPSKGHHDKEPAKESSSPSKKSSAAAAATTAETSTPATGTSSSSTSSAQATKASKGGERREKNKAQVLKDMAACRQILEELEQHKDAWPFLLPVNTKQFPSYRKFIKKPMDVSTMRSKLESNQYKGKDEFALDVRLIFDNCETFNEDDSPVGQAGHNMRNFFESRWEELTS